MAVASAARPAWCQLPYLLKDINPGYAPSIPYEGEVFVDWGGRAAFAATTPVFGKELWLSDGTPARTKLLLDINPGPASGLVSLSLPAWGGYYYFTANDGVHGTELWRSDGSAAGTSLFFDFEPGPGSSDPIVRVIPGKLLISAWTSSLGREPWVSDGTVAGTQLLRDIGPGSSSGLIGSFDVTPLGSAALFAASDFVHGVEPWVTDGTPGGTLLLKDLNPGTPNGITQGPFIAAVHGMQALFSANDGTTGEELYATDGTPAGTHLVSDINPGGPSSSPSFYNGYFAHLSTGILFLAFTPNEGSEPWISDGTATGTHLLLDVYPGPTGSQGRIVELDPSSAVFFARSPAFGIEPWITNGTQSGTSVVDLLPGPGDGTIPNGPAYSSRGRAYFGIVTSSGYSSTELGTSDGTVAGTGLTRDLVPGSTTQFGTILPVAGGVFYRMNGDTAYSNGLPRTTQWMPFDSSANFLVYVAKRIGNHIFMSATGFSGGWYFAGEPWAIEVDADGDGAIEYFDTLNFASECLCTPAVAPCANSDPSAGCANSTGVGARIDASGSTLLAADDLVLTVSQLPLSVNGMLLMGPLTVAPVPFNDGIRCVGGTLSRFPAHSSGASGSMTYGPGLAAEALARFGITFTSGSTWRFQCWYRDVIGPCGLGTNASSSGSVVFTP